MLNPGPYTFKPNLLTTDHRRRFRNQATGIGQTLSASEQTGARRSQCVANAIPGPADNPSDNVKARDRSYPAPNGGATDCSTTAYDRAVSGVPLRGGRAY